MNCSRELPFSKYFIDRIISSMQDGLIIFNSEGHIEIANEAALNMLGFHNATDLVTKSIRDILADPEHEKEVISFSNQENHNQECAFRKADGQVFTGVYSTAIINDLPEGDRIKMIIFHDVSSRKNNEHQLKEYATRLEKINDELDQFAYIVSHDLKAPLRAINNISHWLQEDLDAILPDDSRKNLALLRARVLRMEALINGVLEYSRIGRTQIQYELLEINTLLNDVLEILSPPANVKIMICSSIPMVYAPRIMLTQVLTNLINNAIKYNDKEKPVIKVHAMEEGNHYKFMVEDNGPGIDKEYHENVFKIFQTLQSRDDVESTGIGLTIVKKLVEACGGMVWIESTAGNGCTVLFTWPRKDRNMNSLLKS